MTRVEIVERIDNWEQRLSALVEVLREWYGRLPGAEHKDFLEGSILQVSEEILKDYDVPPRMLPHCAVLFGKNRVSFVPGPLWILGANGRMNVTTNKKQFVLVDIGGKDNQPSDWQIVVSRLQATYRPFTEEIFRELVLHQELAVA